VLNHLTLDGVMQAPGRPDEDPRGGFGHGGWAQLHSDPAVMAAMGQELADAGPYLFGRRSYENFAAFWPHQTDGNPYTESLDRNQKYVASRTLTEPLRWENSTVLAGDAAESVAALKERETKDLVVFGSGDLLRTLMQHHLVDVYVLMIHPVVLGTGRRMFPDDATRSELRLNRAVTAASGVIIATYHPADAAVASRGQGGATR